MFPLMVIVTLAYMDDEQISYVPELGWFQNISIPLTTITSNEDIYLPMYDS